MAAWRAEIARAGAHRANALDLDSGMLLQAVREGLSAKIFLDRFDPKLVGGVLTWGRTFGALSRYLEPMGWTRVAQKNWYRLLHPSGRKALLVMTGLPGGCSDGLARPRSKKAPSTLLAQAVFQTKLELEFLDKRGRPVEPKTIENWILMFTLRGDGYEVVMGLPYDMIDGRVSEYRDYFSVGWLKPGIVAAPARLSEPRSFRVDIEPKANGDA